MQTTEDKKNYQNLLNLLSKQERDRFCTPINKRYNVYSRSGGTIRARPDINSKRIASIPSGNTVIATGQEGEWVKMYSRWGDGYMHESIFKYRAYY